MQAVLPISTDAEADFPHGRVEMLMVIDEELDRRLEAIRHLHDALDHGAGPGLLRVFTVEVTIIEHFHDDEEMGLLCRLIHDLYPYGFWLKMGPLGFPE